MQYLYKTTHQHKHLRHYYSLMKQLAFKFSLSLALCLSVAQLAQAGNDSKRGQGGASQLTVNPWARSSGMGGSNAGGIRGLESMNMNIAGLAYLKSTSLMFSTVDYLRGSDIRVNSLAFGTPLSGSGVLGMSVSAFSLGNFTETTFELPEGTGNTFKPTVYNIAVGYSKKFSKSITGGILLRGVYEGIANVNAFGVGFDAGIQYQTGENDRFKFGVTIQNVGPKMQYRGEGLSFRGGRDDIGLTVASKSQASELPSLISISTMYDFLSTDLYRISGAFAFTSNSYTKDNIVPGAEFAFRDLFMVRAGYVFKQRFSFSQSGSTDAHTGLCAGATFNVPLSKNKNGEVELETTVDADAKPKKNPMTLGIDYSFRATAPFNGTHSLGVIVSF